MSTAMHIKSSETGVLRVFHIDLPREAIERFTTQAGTGEWPLQYALGAKSLRADFVEVINVKDLGDMPLSQYLINAHDVSGRDFDAVRSRLDALTGFVLVLPSQAFDRTEQDLTISAPLRWIGTFNEPTPSSTTAPIRTASAKGIGGGASAPAPKGSNASLWIVFGLLALIALGIIFAKFLLN
ncbi:aspartate carbamoyltransferase catalytic subunit [uncultured Marivita sp.]|uniref:aspartate carbamoyltransferase catalytic subunit n=1 Tax=uncultured Marivita sp. TaxID=888080 RepID=UPI00262255E3|nr:aspartate carbamoyltransferase catalytic subunit [uncultured Marivita sp.]